MFSFKHKRWGVYLNTSSSIPKTSAGRWSIYLCRYESFLFCFFFCRYFDKCCIYSPSSAPLSLIANHGKTLNLFYTFYSKDQPTENYACTYILWMSSLTCKGMNVCSLYLCLKLCVIFCYLYNDWKWIMTGIYDWVIYRKRYFSFIS